MTTPPGTNPGMSPDTDGGHSAALASLGRIGVIGSGAVGGTLARALAARGGAVVAVTALHRETAEALAVRIPGCRAVATPEEVVETSDLIVLAVPDDTIAALAERVPWSPGQQVVHLSGARGTQALISAAKRGATVAALHPLMTFTYSLAALPVDELLARLRGCIWALETDDPALREALQTVVAALGGQVTLLSASDRIPYHISGVLASNYIVTLIGAAVGLWESFGVDAGLARSALLPLLRAAVENLAVMEPSAALSGPIARGDIGTLHAHLEWLESAAVDSEQMRDIKDAYVALARLAIPLAEARGTLTAERVAAMRALLGEVHPVE
jgi:predicted short-subunit dehydrogenase-like oxidoreductase (DUF2520 family)